MWGLRRQLFDTHQPQRAQLSLVHAVLVLQHDVAEADFAAGVVEEQLKGHGEACGMLAPEGGARNEHVCVDAAAGREVLGKERAHRERVLERGDGVDVQHDFSGEEIILGTMAIQERGCGDAMQQLGITRASGKTLLSERDHLYWYTKLV